MRLFLLLLLPFLLTTCDGNTAARKAARGEDFVAEPNRLYFKNTRTRNYITDERREDVTVYRHGKLLSSEAALLPVIADHWLEDRANIRFEIRQSPEAAPTPRPFRLDLNRQTGWETLPLTVPPTTEELNSLRGHLATRQEIRIVMGLDTLNPFPEEARKYAKEVLDDYLRLVED